MQSVNKQIQKFMEKCHERLRRNNKGNSMGVLWGLLTLVAVLMIAGIFMALGANMTNDIATDFTANSYEKNITDESLDAQYTVAKKQGLIATVGIISIVLGLLMSVVVGFLAYTRYF